MPARTVEIAFLGSTAQLEAALTRAGLVATESSDKIKASAKSAGEASAAQAKAAGASADEQAAAAGRAAAAYTEAQARISRAQKVAGDAAAQAARAVGLSADQVAAASKRAIASQGELEAASKRAAAESEASGMRIGTAFEKGTGKAGSALTRLGGLGSSWGIPLSGALTNIGKKFDDAATHGQKLGAAMSGLGKMTLTAGLAGFAAAAFEGVKGAMSLQKQMEMLHTQAGASDAQVKELTHSVEDMAGKVGIGPTQLAEGLYHIASNMNAMLPPAQRASKEMDALKISAEGAKVGNADLESVTNALGAAIASGLPGVQDYSKAMGMLNATVGAGDMRMQDLADALGTGLLGPMKNYGISLRDVSAALAVFGDNNIRGQDAATKLNSAIRIMAAPSNAAAKALSVVGMSTLRMANDMRSGGLIKALTDLQTHLRNSGATASQQALIIARAFGGRQSTGVQLLLGQLDRLKAKYQDVGRGANTFGQSWAATQKTLAQQMDQLKGTVQGLSDKFGMWLIPKLEAVAKATSSVISWFERHKMAADALAGAIGTVLGGAVAVYVGTKAVQFISMTGKMVQAILGLAGKIASAVGSIVGWFTAEGAGAETMAATTVAADETIAVSTEETAAAVDVALGSTGVGLIVVGLGVAVTALATNWQDAMNAIVAAAQWMVNACVGILNSLIDSLNSVISLFNDTIGQLTGSIGSVGGVGGVNFGGGGSGGSDPFANSAGTGDQIPPGALSAQQHWSPSNPSGASIPSMPSLPSTGGGAGSGGGLSPGALSQLTGGGGGSGSHGRGSSVAQSGTQKALKAGAMSAVLQWANLALQAGQKYGINPALLLADIQEESGGNPNAVSPAGAFGLTQFMPGTAAQYGVQRGGSASAVMSQVMGQAHYLSDLMHQFGGNIVDALAAYNAGPGKIGAGMGYARTVLGLTNKYSPMYSGGASNVARSVRTLLYANPVPGFTPERIDMGQDFAGRPGQAIRSIGAGKVLGIQQNWYQGQPYMAYQLSSGPNAGKVVYVAEQINPGVHAGQQIAAGQQIGTYAAHGTGIEMGFANPHNWRQTLAQATTGYVEGQPTPAGQAFSQFLRQIGQGTYTTTNLLTGAMTGGGQSIEQAIAAAIAKYLKMLTDQGNALLTSLSNVIQSGTVKSLMHTLGASSAGSATGKYYNTIEGLPGNATGDQIAAALKPIIGSTMSGVLQWRDALTADLTAVHGKALAVLDHDLGLKHQVSLDKLVSMLTAEHGKKLEKLITELKGVATKVLGHDLKGIHGHALKSLEKDVGAKHGTTMPHLAQLLAGVHGKALHTLVTHVGKSHNKGLENLLKDLTSGRALTMLSGDLKGGAHKSPAEAQYQQLVAELKATHDKNLQALAKQLIAAHDHAMNALAQELYAEQAKKDAQSLNLQATQLKDQTQIIATMAANIVKGMADAAQTIRDSFSAQATATQDATQAMSDTSAAKVQAIQDQSQIATDTLAERGLYGLNLVAQQQQVALDQTKQGYDRQIAQAQQAVDTAKSNTDNATAAAQAVIDAVQTKTNVAVGAAQANLDNVTKTTDAAVMAAQNAVEQAATGSKAQQDAAQAQLEKAQASQSMQVAQANSALTAAQDAASQAVQQAQTLVDQAGGNASVLIAQAQQTLSGVQSQAQETEAQQQAIIDQTKAEAATQFAGSGLQIHIEGINPTDAAAIATEVGWALRTAIPA